jgi:hypothetical protein
MLEWGDTTNTLRSIRGELIIILALIIGLTGYAHCQNVAPQLSTTLVMVDHSSKATAAPLATPQSLLVSTPDTFAHGEMPDRDIPIAPKTEVPLGDVARWYRTHDYKPARASFVYEGGSN